MEGRRHTEAAQVGSQVFHMLAVEISEEGVVGSASGRGLLWLSGLGGIRGFLRWPSPAAGVEQRWRYPVEEEVRWCRPVVEEQVAERREDEEQDETEPGWSHAGPHSSVSFSPVRGAYAQCTAGGLHRPKPEPLVPLVPAAAGSGHRAHPPGKEAATAHTPLRQ
jgi:hypothetical protein